MTIPSIGGIDVRSKRVLLRADLNLPLQDGRITDRTRLERVVPTIKDLSNRGAKVVVMSHFGRPKGKRLASMSLAPIADAMSRDLACPVTFVQDCTGDDAETAVSGLKDHDVALLENLRFCEGEEANDPAFASGLAALGDLYVNDAFSCAHRAHASTAAIASMLPAYAGWALLAELEALDKALGVPKRPVAAHVGGAKVSSKLEVLDNLIHRVDSLIIGGGMANTDVKTAEGVPETEMILDVGPKTVKAIKAAIERSATLVWNGPLGAFETKPFDAAANQVAEFAAERTEKHGLLTVAGGGDTVAALSGAGVSRAFLLRIDRGRCLPRMARGQGTAGHRSTHRNAKQGF